MFLFQKPTEVATKNIKVERIYENISIKITITRVLQFIENYLLSALIEDLDFIGFGNAVVLLVIL